jgi:DNA-binding transcriptional ArsR family regulator
MDSPRVIVQPGTGYDLLLSASMVANPSRARRLEQTRALRDRADSIARGELSQQIERIGREPFISLMGFLHAMTDDPTANNMLEAARAAPAREVVLAALGYYRRAFRIVTPPQVMRDAVDGDETAIKEFRRTAYPELAYWQTSLRNLLGRDVEETRQGIADALATWHAEGFGALESIVERRQAEDAATVRDLLREHDFETVLERILPGVTFAREVGQETVVLSPSVMIRPGFALTDYGPTLVMAYPAAGALEATDGPPDRLVRLGVPRTTIHHHLGLLVNAGLVRMQVDDARWSTVELREEGVAELAELAHGWIVGRDE